MFQGNLHPNDRNPQRVAQLRVKKAHSSRVLHEALIRMSNRLKRSGKSAKIMKLKRLSAGAATGR